MGYSLVLARVYIKLARLEIDTIDTKNYSHILLTQSGVNIMKYSCYSFRRKLLVTAVSFPGTPDFTSSDGSLSKSDSVLIDHISNGFQSEGSPMAMPPKGDIPELYILQFSNDDLVIDVMHKSMHYKNGHSALQYQFLQGVTPELKMTGPGHGE